MEETLWDSLSICLTCRTRADVSVCSSLAHFHVCRICGERLLERRHQTLTAFCCNKSTWQTDPGLTVVHKLNAKEIVGNVNLKKSVDWFENLSNPDFIPSRSHKPRQRFEWNEINILRKKIILNLKVGPGRCLLLRSVPSSFNHSLQTSGSWGDQLLGFKDSNADSSTVMWD